MLPALENNTNHIRRDIIVKQMPESSVKYVLLKYLCLLLTYGDEYLSDQRGKTRRRRDSGRETDNRLKALK